MAGVGKSFSGGFGSNSFATPPRKRRQGAPKAPRYKARKQASKHSSKS